MRKQLIGSVSALILGVALSGPALAGNIVLTGHDNDFHEDAGSAASNAAFSASVAFVRAGSANPTLPVLSFDAGSELTDTLTARGISFVNINPTAGNVTDALFDPTLYSAFIVASVTTCGGCDNPVGTGTILAGHSAAIASFFNAGGGIYGLAGASDANAYAYVPTAASNPGGSPPSTGYVQTADGATFGIPAVNGDPTHNFFSEPGTGGLSALYKVTERLGSATTGTPETVALAGGTIVCTGAACTITTGPAGVPEPGTLGLLGSGLVALAIKRRRKKQAAA